MATLPGRNCRVLGCAGAATSKNNGYCERHKNRGWEMHQQSKGGQSKRIYSTYAWKKRRETVLKRDLAICQICLAHGIYTLATDVDHIIPVAAGGSNEFSNLQSLCKSCHAKKTAKE